MVCQSLCFLSPRFSDRDIVNASVRPSARYAIYPQTTGRNLTKLATGLSRVVRVCDSNIIFHSAPWSLSVRPSVRPSVRHAISSLTTGNLTKLLGVVGWCEGVVYLMSPGRPNDICLQLGKACYPSGRGGGGCFYFLCFFTFIPIPLSSLSLSFISTISSITFLPFFWETTQNDPQGLTCR